MSKEDTTIYTCDVCGKTTKDPEMYRWFEVQGGLPDGYLCHKCFHDDKYYEFNRWLRLLGIEISGTHRCTQFSDNPELGFIRIESVRLNSDPKDRNRIKIGRRSG